MLLNEILQWLVLVLLVIAVRRMRRVITVNANDLQDLHSRIDDLADDGPVPFGDFDRDL
jgi:hypothetical protein